MRRQSLQNKKAWENRAYDWWLQYNGTPQQAATDMCADPRKWVRRHLSLLGEVKDQNLLIPLGSNGRKAIPLALLGAHVTAAHAQRLVSLAQERRREIILSYPWQYLPLTLRAGVSWSPPLQQTG